MLKNRDTVISWCWDFVTSESTKVICPADTGVIFYPKSFAPNMEDWKGYWVLLEDWEQRDIEEEEKSLLFLISLTELKLDENRFV